MNLLFTILRAGHASGTHHKLAVDALHRLGGPYCESWQRLILKHATLYFEGAKAPDNQFKDFKNHVLHVRDGLWGGAPAKAASWYQHLLAALRDKNWSEAAWCAGVLSHYYTDPLHPFHTGQSAAENNVHRAVEWSISRSYDKLAALGAKALPKLDLELGTGDDWLKDLMVAGATKSNGHYEALLAHYDFQRGVVDPPSGLDPTAQAFVGELIQYAVLSFALVLQRAFKESAVVPPDVGLTVETVLATLKLPAKAILKRIDDTAMRRQVEAMYDELQATGRVEKSMPEDERILKALHDKEVLTKTGTFDAKDALASNKARSARDRRPVVPHLQSASAGQTVPGARSPATAQPPTPPAPPVSGLAPRGMAAHSAVPAPVAVPGTPVVPAPAISVQTPANQISQTEPATPMAAPASQQPDADPVIVTAPLAAAAANAAASALSGLGSPRLMNRLRPMIEPPAAVIVERETEQEPAAAPAPAVREESSTEDLQSSRSAPAAIAALAPQASASTPPVTPSDTLSLTIPKAVEPRLLHPEAAAEKPARVTPRAEPGQAQAAPITDAADDMRCHLSPERDVVDGPSIGPKAAERLKVVGINTVADLFAADPGALAEALDVSHIRAKTIAEWQDQARLVCEIPGLRGTHAQLLVGAGYRDLRRIARADARELSTDLLRYIQTADGQRILRSGGGPDLEKIMSWVKAAERVLVAKAA
jgi:predicted flap endonuclease-1-like 5' DNA nuclease